MLVGIKAKQKSSLLSSPHKKKTTAGGGEPQPHLVSSINQGFRNIINCFFGSFIQIFFFFG